MTGTHDSNASKPLILIVDDDPRNVQVLAVMLAADYEIIVAADGEKALAAVAETAPDLILLDIMMPGMDGIAVCRKLKSNRATAVIPVIFLTALAQSDNIVRGFEAGAVDYVTKPFRKEELLARIKTHVQLRQLQSLLPICAYCHKIRDDKGDWEQIEAYISNQTGSQFSHGVCPECLKRVLKESGAE
jgi:DNA-binding response OmpR family regulator